MLKIPLINKIFFLAHQKYVEYLLFAIPYLIILTFICLSIETISFPGFIAKYLLLSSQLLFLLSFLALSFQAYLSIYLNKHLPNEFLLFIFKLNRIGVVALVIINHLFIALENEHYPNYIFASFHVHLAVLRQLVLLSVAIASIEFIISNKPLMIYLKKRFTSFIQFIFIISILVVVIPQAQETFTMVSSGSIDILRAPLKSYDVKIVAQMNGNDASGWVYTYAQFLNKYLPENSVIFIPPQVAPWLMEGNQYYMRWFVYPRQLSYSRDIEADIPENVTHIMVAHGSWPWGAQTFGWPRITISKERIARITLIDKSTMEEKTFEGIDYEWQEDLTRWGFIELRK